MWVKNSNELTKRNKLTAYAWTDTYSWTLSTSATREEGIGVCGGELGGDAEVAVVVDSVDSLLFVGRTSVGCNAGLPGIFVNQINLI